jgi:uncharacterized protein
MSISRRVFLEATGLAGFATQVLAAEKIDQKTGMPTREFGKTGARISVLGMGCGSRLLSYKEQDKAVEALTKAMDLGVRYLDTAYSYGNGKSETWVGAAIPGRRKELWITTKVQERDGAKAMAIIEGSLKRLGVSQVDLIHIHSLLNADDLAVIEAKGGVLETLYKAKAQKMTRFIGVTSHTDPRTLATALERHDFDCTQMALNAALVGMMNGTGGMVINKGLGDSFEKIALPVALKKKMGVTAMKVYAQEGLVGAAPLESLFRYALTLPVAGSVVGMPKLEHIPENVKFAKTYRPFGPGEMRDLSTKLSREHKARLDRFFADHIDA